MYSRGSCIPEKNIQSQVEHFYEKMEWETTAGRIYSDAWGLRKLYSYALRREGDVFKRDQTPADPCQDYRPYLNRIAASCT